MRYNTAYREGHVMLRIICAVLANGAAFTRTFYVSLAEQASKKY